MRLFSKHLLLTLCFFSFVTLCKSQTCCKSGDPDVILDNTSIAQAVAAGDLDSIETNEIGICILIKGTLIIDQHYSFVSSELRLDQGARIIVQSGFLLKMLLTNLKGCTYLWDRILVQGGARLQMRTCNVADAYYAIDAKDHSSFNLDNVVFDNNYVAIYSKALQLNKHRIVHCSFLNTSGELKDEGLNDPLPVNYSLYGIQVIDLTALYVGYPVFDDNSEVSPLNVFDDIHTGIHAENANITVHGAQFKYLDTGIRLIEGASLTQSGLGAPPPNSPGVSVTPSFQSVAHPVYGTNMGSFARITHNLIENSDQYGLRFEQLGPESQINISRNNIINNYAIPIWIYDFNSFGNVLIENNYIEDASAEYLLSSGIDVSVELPFLSESFIQNNEIRLGWDEDLLFDNRIAINITNNGPNIRDNNIGLLSSSFISTDKYGGISVKGSGSAAAPFILCNHIEAEAVTDDFFGISVQAASSTVVNCNNLENIETGIRFSGVCSNTDFRGNAFKDHAVGLYLTSSIMGFGIQEHKGNTWSGTYSSNGARYEGNLIDLQLYEFEVDQNDVITNPELMPPSPFPATGWFELGSGNTFICPNICDPGIEWQLTSTDEDIAAGHLEPAVYEAAQKWLAAKRLYRKVEDHDLLGLNPTVDSFYHANTNTNIGHFVGIEKAMEAAVQPDSTLLGQLNGNRDQVIYLLDTIAMIEKDLATATGQDSIDMITEVLLYTGQLYDLATEQDSLRTVAENNRNDSLDLIIPLNTAVFDTTTQGNNIKTYNAIRLNHLYRGDDSLSSTQMTDLYNIANQCPYSGGDVVFAARAAYHVLSDSIYYFDDNALCTQQSSLVSSNPSPVLSKERTLGTDQMDFAGKIILYPNPADQFANLWVDQIPFDRGKMILFDVLGKQVLQIPLSGGQQNYTFDTSFLPDGIYLYKVWMDSKEVFIGNLSIIGK